MDICERFPDIEHFNSIKVQLELINGLSAFNVYFDFNSIKVQLEHAAAAMLSANASISIP